MFIDSDYFLVCSPQVSLALCFDFQAAKNASLAFSRDPSLFFALLVAEAKNERVRKKRYQAQANDAYITTWPGALSALPPWPTRPRCSPIKSGQMLHSAVVVDVVVFVHEAPLPPSATKQSKAKRRRKCGQKTSAALMGEEGGERGVERKGGSLTEVEHCVFDSSSFPPYSTPIPCGFVYVRRLCCVSVINEITLFLLLLLPPGISCFCLFVVSFCFCVIFFLLHFIVVVVMSLLLFVSCCCPLACRQSLQHGVRLRLWL